MAKVERRAFSASSEVTTSNRARNCEDEVSERRGRGAAVFSDLIERPSLVNPARDHPRRRPPDPVVAITQPTLDKFLPLSDREVPRVADLSERERP